MLLGRVEYCEIALWIAERESSASRKRIGFRRELGPAGIAGGAGGVGEQVVDRHPVAGVGRIVGQVLRDRVVERQLAFLHQLEDERGGELLRDRPQAKLGVGRVGHVPLHVGHPVAFLEDHLPVGGHQGGAVEEPVGMVGRQEPVDGPGIGRGGAVLGQRGAEREKQEQKAEEQGRAHGYRG